MFSQRKPQLFSHLPKTWVTIAKSVILALLVCGLVLSTAPVKANSVKKDDSNRESRSKTERVKNFSQPLTNFNLNDRQKIDFSDTGRPKRTRPSQVPTPKTRTNLDFSATGRPGQRTAGGSRNNCFNSNFSLTAFLPSSHLGKTVSERPTFWFYSPYFSQSKLLGEFVLQDEQRNDIYRIPFVLDRPTIDRLISFSAPETTAPLQIDRSYRWYFKVYCTPERSSSPIFVQGWVQRVALEPIVKLKLENTSRPDLVYAENGIWYDALNYLVQMRLSKPNSPTLQNDWKKLLTAKGVELKLPER
jgi:hypothetical protein